MGIKIQAVFDDDSIRFHRFLVDPNPYGITGSVYIPKGKEIPDEITIRLMTKAERENGTSSRT
jgi:hypothetical protein